MPTPKPEKADDLNKVSPLLGTRAAQAAVDGLARNVNKINDGLNKVAASLAKMQQASGATRWNGNSTFGQQAGGKGNGGGYTVGQHWDNTFLNGGGGSTGQQSNGKGNGGWGAAAIGSVAASGWNKYADTTAINTTAQMLSRGSTMPWADVRSMGMRNNVTAISNVDAAQGLANVADLGYGLNSRQMQGAMAYNRSFGFVDPTLSSAQVGNAQARMGQGQMYNYMLGRGINTMRGSNGVMTPRELANSMMTKMARGRGVMSKDQANAYATSRGAGGVAIDSLVRSGQIDQDTAQVLRSEMRQQAIVNANGFTFEQYNKAVQSGDKDTLKKMGLPDTDITSQKRKDAANRNIEDNTAEGFSQGVQTANTALAKFANLLDGITDSWIGKAIGMAQGFGGSFGSSGVGGGALLYGASKVLPGLGGGGATAEAAGGGGGLLGGGAASLLGGFGVAAASAFGVTFAGMNYDKNHPGEGFGTPGELKYDARTGSVVMGDGKGGHQIDWKAVHDATKGGTGGDSPLTQGGSGGKSGGRTVKLQRPCGGPVTSKFGPRKSPGGIGSKNHKGIDIGVPNGTPIVAANSGKVVTVSFQSARGNYVVVDHGDGIQTLYQHLSASRCRPGQSVRRGQVIASSGNTGASTGPHLHFEVHLNGNPVDPLPYIGGGGMVGSGNSNQLEPLKEDAGASATASAGPSASPNAPTGTSEAAIVAAALSGSGLASGSGASAGGSKNAEAAGGKSKSNTPTPKGGVSGWVQQALGILGLPYDKYGKAIETIIQHESGGNPKAINKWDSNAKAGHPSKGLMQTIDSTFNKYKMDGHGDIWNPVDNILAATRYALSRYGTLDNVPGIKSLNNGGGYKGYAVGSTNVDVDQIAKIHKGEMVLDVGSAEALRTALKGNNSTIGMLGGSGGRKVVLNIHPGAIVLQASGPMNDSQSSLFAQQMVRAFANQSELLTIAEG